MDRMADDSDETLESLSHWGPAELLALGSGAFVLLGAVVAVTWQPGFESRSLAFLLAGTSGCMVAAMLVEVLPKYRSAMNDAALSRQGLADVEKQEMMMNSLSLCIGVLALTLLLLIVAEWLLSEPLERLRRLQGALTRRAERHPAGDSAGTQLADYVIASWATPAGGAAGTTADRERSTAQVLDAIVEEGEGAPTHEALVGVLEHSNARHLRQLVRSILRQRLLEESLEDTICRLAGRSIVELDVTLDRWQFHDVMRRLMGTSQTRSDLIWRELNSANGQKWPSLRVLAAAVHGHSNLRRGLTRQDLAEEDPLDYEEGFLWTVWALEFADRCFNGAPGSESAKSDGDLGGAYAARAHRTAHLQRVIERISPYFEALLTTVGAAALHLFSGIVLAMVVMQPEPCSGVILAVLHAVRNFPEGVVFAKDIMASLSRRHGSRYRRRALYAGAIVALCDFLGAASAIEAIKWTGKFPSGRALGAVYFVNGGLMLGLGVRKYLRAAVACDPENKLPTIAWMSGMIVTTLGLVAVDTRFCH